MKIIVEVSKYDILSMAKSLGLSDDHCQKIEKYLETHDSIKNTDFDEKSNRCVKTGMSSLVVALIVQELSKEDNKNKD